LALKFATAHVQEPLTWEMTQRFKRLMFNINSLDVGVHDADMRLVLIGEPLEVKKAKAYLIEQGVTLKTLSAARYKGKIPSVPKRSSRYHQDQPVVERKLWLTMIGPQRREPFLWAMARRFDVVYKIMHAATGETVAIVSLLLWGPEEAVEDAVSYLREQGINVEYGEIGVSAPFTPVG
jgi:hypothetical protein